MAMSFVVTILAAIVTFIDWDASSMAFSNTALELIYFAVPAAFFGTLLGLSVNSVFVLRRIELALGACFSTLLILNCATAIVMNIRYRLV